MNNIDILEEKEKKTIEYLKLVAKERTLIPLCDDIKILLNLVETLIAENKEVKEEIEELKENNGYHLGFIDGGIAKRYEYEDKIKAKIEDILNSENGEAIEKLIEWQSLLGKE